MLEKDVQLTTRERDTFSNLLSFPESVGDIGKISASYLKKDE